MKCQYKPLYTDENRIYYCINMVLMNTDLFVWRYLMWGEAPYQKGLLRGGVCGFCCRAKMVPHPAFHLLPSHTPAGEQECRVTNTHLSHSRSFMHTYKGLHKSSHKHELFPSQCNMSRHVHTASHLDVTALPGLLCYIKNLLLSLSKLQADGGESAWLSPRSCESCLCFSLSVYFGV